MLLKDIKRIYISVIDKAVLLLVIMREEAD